MQKYLNLLRDVRDNGQKRFTRSGVVYSVFDRKIEFDMREHFPAPTTKRLMWKAMVGELLWFLNGKNDLTSLRHYSDLDDDAWTIWTDDCKRWHEASERECDKEDLGKLYGHQWRNVGGDQIAKLVHKMIHDKNSRYQIVMAWNPEDIDNDEMALAPCHLGFTVYVDGNEFDLKWRQRSVDTFLGLPFNIASYGLLMHILGKITGLTPRRLIGDLDDVHIYHDHLDAVNEQLSRVPEEDPDRLPQVVLPDINWLHDLVDLTAKDFTLINYRPQPAIPAKLSVG